MNKENESAAIIESQVINQESSGASESAAQEKQERVVPESIKAIYESACAAFDIKPESTSKLKLLKLDYSYRVRAIKDDSGETVGRIMDRGFIGLTKSKVGLDPDSMDVVNCFIYGKKTVGAYIENNSIYANKNLKTSGDFITLLFNIIESQGLVFQGWIDLPTGEKTATGGDLASCIAKPKTIDELAADVQLF